MDVTIDIVNLLSQVSAAVPIIAPFQPILGTLKMILERAQVLSNDREKLARLAWRAARLSLILHEQVGEHTDNLSDKVKSHLDGINTIVDSILSAFQRLEKRSKFPGFLKYKKVTDTVFDLYQQLVDSVHECQVVLGIESSAKLTKTCNVVVQTQEQISTLESRIVHSKSTQDQFQVDSKSKLEIVHRGELILKKLINTREVRINNEQVVTITDFEALLRETTPVRVRQFSALKTTFLKRAFEKELVACTKLWSSYILQPRGQSDRNGPINYIIYYSPPVNSRVPLRNVFGLHFALEPALVMRTLFALGDLIKQWGTFLSIYPTTLSEHWGECDSYYELWLDNIAFDAQQLNGSVDVFPIFEGDLCAMKKSDDADASDVFMHCIRSRLRWWYLGFQVPTLIYAALAVRWNAPDSLKGIPFTVDSLATELRESGWLSLDSKPSLFANETIINYRSDYRWFQKPNYIRFWQRYWDIELKCRVSESVYWWHDSNHGELRLICNCPHRGHGDFFRRIDRLRINWPCTPLDGLEYRSDEYIYGWEYE